MVSVSLILAWIYILVLAQAWTKLYGRLTVAHAAGLLCSWYVVQVKGKVLLTQPLYYKVEFDTRSIFEQSTTGLNSEFSFS